MLELDNYEIRTRDLATVLGVTPQTLARWVHMGMPRKRQGVFDVREAIGWCIHHGKQASLDDAPSLIAARRKLYEAQEAYKVFELARARGEVLPFDALDDGLLQMAGAFASALEGLGARLAGVVASLPSVAEIEVAIERETRDIRETVAEQARALGASPPPSLERDTTAPEPHRGPVGGRKKGHPARKPRARPVEN